MTDPAAIFAAARTAWSASSYAHYADYDTVVDYQSGNRHMRRTWITTEDLRHAIVTSRVFSREDLADPAAPTGINISIPLLGGALRHKDPEPVGQLALAVDQDFDLSPTAIHPSYRPPSDTSLISNTLVTIGRTSRNAPAQLYHIELLDSRDAGSGAVYHLKLTPVSDPWRHRLRELWIDAKTMRPTAAVVSGIANRAPLTEVSWHVDFAWIDDGMFVTEMDALAPLDYGGNGDFTHMSIRFTDLRLASRPLDPLALDIGTGEPPETVQGDP